jgi:hypothetical protein
MLVLNATFCINCPDRPSLLRAKVTAEDVEMAMTSTEPQRSKAQILTDYLEGAGLAQRGGAKALRIPYPTMRRYCSASLVIPVPVLLAAQRLPLVNRNSRIIRMVNSGKLSMKDGPITKARLIDNNKRLRHVIDFLVGRTATLR